MYLTNVTDDYDIITSSNITDYDNLTLTNCTNSENNNRDNNTIIHNNSLQFAFYLFNIFNGVYISQTFFQ